MATVTKDLGPVTAYKYAVSKGYTGTEEEFAQLMADLANMSARLDDVEDDVEQVEGSVVYMGDRVTTVETKTANINQDSNHLVISASHVDVPDGYLTVRTSSTAGESRLLLNTSGRCCRLAATSSTRRIGIWDSTNEVTGATDVTDGWMILSDANGAVDVPHKFTFRNSAAPTTVGEPIQSYTENAYMIHRMGTPSTSGVGVYGRWGVANAAVSGKTISASPSDNRLKYNIKPATKSGLDLINSLPVKQFDWVEQNHKHWDFGIVAQEVRGLDENLIIGEEKEDMYLGIDTLYLCDILVKAVQELSAKVEELEQIVNA